MAGNVTSVRGMFRPGFEEHTSNGEGRDFAKVMPPRHWSFSLARQPIRAASTDADFPAIGPRARSDGTWTVKGLCRGPYLSLDWYV